MNRARIVVLAALASTLLRFACQLNFVDVDLFHEMALFRAALSLGHIPRDDIFAYTPTLHPVVHHEWLTGAVLYGVSMAGGAAGLILFKYILIAGIAFFTARAARLRGAAWTMIFALAPVAMVLVQNGFTTIRAQVFTMVFTAALMLLIEHDRTGKRLWIVPWLFAHVIWLNLHGGFVVGLVILATHFIEQVVRTKKPQTHLILGGLAMAALVCVNPWGFAYVGYLIRALTMSRIVGEWNPIWSIGEPQQFGAYLVALVIFIYCFTKVGWKKMPGALLVLLFAYLGAKTARNATLFAIVWLAHVPVWIAQTPLGEGISRFTIVRRAFLTRLAAVIGVFMFVSTLVSGAFDLRINTEPNPDPDVIQVAFPAGATRYLEETHFRGNVLTHFNTGSFVSWSNFPNVKVGLDSRYEVAYPPDVVADVQDFYLAHANWKTALTKYPTDLALVAGSRKIAELMRTETDWKRVYRDDGFELYARPGLDLPVVDRSGQLIVARFP